VPSSRPQAPTGSSHTRSATDRMNRNDPTEASVPPARSTATPRIPRRLAICPAQGQLRPIWVEESPTTRVSTAPSRRSRRGGDPAEQGIPGHGWLLGEFAGGTKLL
jgi:hypothetical protein